jgi:hypothetical protein
MVAGQTLISIEFSLVYSLCPSGELGGGSSLGQ